MARKTMALIERKLPRRVAGARVSDRAAQPLA